MRFALLVASLFPLAFVCGAENVAAKWDPAMAVAQATVDTNGVRWIDGTCLPVEGRTQDCTDHYYDRLASNLTEKVNAGVRNMRHYTAGMQFRFVTDSRTLRFRWVPYLKYLEMDHMPASGVSGIDVYRWDTGRGKWLYVKTGRIYKVEGGALEIPWTPGDRCLVNLPLYNGVSEFKLGLDAGATLDRLPPRASGIEKPVVFYGTSITHGGCASRPGMAFPSIIGRDLDVPIVNLGFSGSGRMEFEMSDRLADIDASCYVLDCLPNLQKIKDTPDFADVRNRNDPLCIIRERYGPFIRNLRARRPDVPIVMAEHCSVYCRGKGEDDRFIRTLYEKLIAEGWKNVVYLPKEGMYADDFEGTVDGAHPNDWGMMHMAAAYGGAVRRALGLERRWVPNTLYDQSEPVGLPELMRTSDGRTVSSVADWESLRRPEILNFFTRNVYGERPVERPADLRFEPLGEDCEFPEIPAVRKRVRISFSGSRGSWSFNACVFVPKGASADKPVPAFLLICNRALDRFADVDRRVRSGFFPVEEIVRRGYAAAVFKNTELALDDYHPSFAVDGTAVIQDPSFTNGFYACWAKERTETSWGAISAWAWGASRVLDWLETVSAVDARRVAVVGHSRGGKTALWAGACDVRFALVCANDSGCCGAKLNHVAVSLSETIRQDNANNPHWFCRAFRRFNGRDFVLPYDQHWLAALVAPRLLYIASASEDAGAGPWGEFLTARHTSPAWRLYGTVGLVENHPYRIDQPYVDGLVGYHLRKGPHDLTEFDWHRFMDFADRHLTSASSLRK